MEHVRIVPANEASWEDLQAIFMTNREGRSCACQWFKHRDKDWKSIHPDALMSDLREQTGCGHVDAERTSGLVAYVGDEPAGWVAVEPRVRYQRLLRMRTPWVGRDEDKQDDGVWVVSCFLIRKEFRGEHLTHALAAATIPFAKARGARALEAYPMLTEPGKEVMWGELYVGPATAFEAAGFPLVTTPSKRRRVVRIEF